MGLLSRLRGWLGGGSGVATEDEPDDGATDPCAGDATEGSAAAATTADEPESGGAAPGDAAGGQTGLDPSAVTETRTTATDDAVDALRDVRRSHEASASDGDAEDADDALPEDADDRARDAG